MSSVDWTSEQWKYPLDANGVDIENQIEPITNPFEYADRERAIELPDDVKARLLEWRARIFEAIDDEEVGGRGVARE